MRQKHQTTDNGMSLLNGHMYPCDSRVACTNLSEIVHHEFADDWWSGAVAQAGTVCTCIHIHKPKPQETYNLVIILGEFSMIPGFVLILAVSFSLVSLHCSQLPTMDACGCVPTLVQRVWHRSNCQTCMALILPGHQRAAVLQGICLRNARQNLSTVMEQRIFPAFKTFKCRILTRFGMKGVVAGVPRRPIIPNPCETTEFVVKYVSNVTGLALNEPIFVKDLQSTLLFERLPEVSAADRHNLYASFMKGLRKRRACAALDDVN